LFPSITLLAFTKVTLASKPTGPKDLW